MKRIIIKIDPTSIRRNPNAGNTVTMVQGKKEVTFEIEGNIPEFIKQPPFFIEQWNMVNGKMIYAKGSINGPVEQKYIDKAPNLRITIKYNPIRIDHHPEPDYLYDYEETFLKCKKCKNKVKINDIENDWVSDEFEVTICPVCQTENSFPKFEYEEIDHAIKRAYKKGLRESIERVLFT